jgi:hypothetical protein
VARRPPRRSALALALSRAIGQEKAYASQGRHIEMYARRQATRADIRARWLDGRMPTDAARRRRSPPRSTTA